MVLEFSRRYWTGQGTVRLARLDGKRFSVPRQDRSCVRPLAIRRQSRASAWRERITTRRQCAASTGSGPTPDLIEAGNNQEVINYLERVLPWERVGFKRIGHGVLLLSLQRSRASRRPRGRNVNPVQEFREPSRFGSWLTRRIPRRARPSELRPARARIRPAHRQSEVHYVTRMGRIHHHSLAESHNCQFGGHSRVCRWKWAR